MEQNSRVLEGKIQKVEKKIAEINTYLQSDISKNTSLERSEKRKKCLYGLMQTVRYYQETGRMKKTGFSSNVNEIRTIEKKKYKSTENNLNRNINYHRTEKVVKSSLSMIEIVLIFLSVIICFCALGSWFEINGYRVNFFKVIQNSENALGYGGELLSDYVLTDAENLINGLKLIVIMVVGIAVLYVGMIYQFIKSKASKLVFLGTGYIGAIIIAFFILTQMINHNIEDSLGWSGIQLSLTSIAWITLILSVLISVIYYHRWEFDLDGLHKYERKSWEQKSEETQKKVRSFSITNYYPWINIKLLTLVIEKSEDSAMWMQYVYRDNLTWDDSGLFFNANVDMTVDIIIDVRNEKYVIREEKISISKLVRQGSTEKIYLSSLPFSVEEVRNVQVFVREIKSGDKAAKKIHDVYVDSGMMAKELETYRKKTQCNALCEERDEKDGWICTCGLLNDYGDDQCFNCGFKHTVQ